MIAEVGDPIDSLNIVLRGNIKSWDFNPDIKNIEWAKKLETELK